MKRFLASFLVGCLTLGMLAATLPLAAANADVDVTVLENLVLQSNNAAYTPSTSLRVKCQQNATERVILLKFDYSSVDLSKIGEVQLNLYSIFAGGAGQENPGRARLYWTTTISWNENTTAFSALPTELNEIGDNLIEIPKVENENSPATNKYYVFDVTRAIFAHNNLNIGSNQITLVIRQDLMTNSNGGMDFASRTHTSGNAPKLTFIEGDYTHTEDTVLIAKEDTTLQSNNSAYSPNTMLRVKHQQGATERVILLKFDYNDVNISEMGDIYLSVYNIHTAGAVGGGSPNLARLYWTTDISWNESTTAFSALPHELTEIGNNAVNIPTTSPSTNQYYNFDVTGAIIDNADLGNMEITFVLRQDTHNLSSGGMDFASREAGADTAPKLTFHPGEGAIAPDPHIENGETVAASEAAQLRYGTNSSSNYHENETIRLSNNENIDEMFKAVMKFDLSKYSAEEIAGAGIRLFVTEADRYFNTMLELTKINEADWTEADVTGATPLSKEGYETDYIVDSKKDVGYWLDIDATTLVKSSAGSILAVMAEQVGDFGGGLSFATKHLKGMGRVTPHIVIRKTLSGTKNPAYTRVADGDIFARYDTDASENMNNVSTESLKKDLVVKYSSSSDRKAFVKFDLSGANVDFENIVAELQLYQMEKSGTGVENSTIGIYYCPDSNWEESVLNGENSLGMVQKALKSENLVTTVVFESSVGNSGYKKVDITDFVRKKVNEHYTQNITFMLVQTEPAIHNNGGIAFTSKESSSDRGAKLVISQDIPEGYIAAPVLEDGYVRYGSYSGTNYSIANNLEVRNTAEADSRRETYLKVGITDIPDNYDGNINLLIRVSDILGTDFTGQVYASYDAEWTENFLNGNFVSGSLLTNNMDFITSFTIRNVKMEEYVAINVSDYVKNVIEFNWDNSIKNITFKIVGANEGEGVTFYARESGFYPMLALDNPQRSINIANYTETNVGNDTKVSMWLALDDSGASLEGFVPSRGQKASVTVAAYNEGRLLKILTDSLSLSKEYTNHIVTLESVYGADVKLFVWDSLANIVPLKTQSAIIDVAEDLQQDYYDGEPVGSYEVTLNSDLVGDSYDYIGEDREKLVVLAVMGNQRTPTYSGMWRMWSNNIADYNPATTNEEGKRNIPSPNYPSIGLYDASDPDYVEYQMQLLKMTGVDVVSVYFTPISEDAWKETTIRNITVPLLQKYGIKAFPRASVDSSAYGTKSESVLQKIYQDLNIYMDIFGESLLKIDNKPVFSFFHSYLSKSELDEWIASCDEEPFVLKWQWKPSNIPEEWYNGMFSWVNLNGIDATQNSLATNYYSVSATKSNYIDTILSSKATVQNRLGYYYADGVAPAFDDTYVNGWGDGSSTYISEAGTNGEIYKYKWAHAVENQFPMVMIPTWDDWCEGTTIQPSLEYGNKYLEITRHYAAKYKGAEENTANFNVPDWIYKIRKSTTNTKILYDMEIASAAIARGDFIAAQALVEPHAFELRIPNVTTLFQ
ncbi:MAG: DNRLRE domain-containing protein [Firmicutes bacterium]|nr:DNRLRE domain-containing protein [Bacillota bacterium]